MARAFVASSAPPGWKLGRWSQVGAGWQEEKLENSKIVHSFQVVNGAGTFNGSTTVRLKMKDQNTEVMLLAESAQVFVNGSYFGEYGGSWTSGSKQSVAPKQSAGQRAPPAAAPAAAAPAGARVTSKQSEQAPLETTQLPGQMGQKAAPQKSAPPAPDRKASREPAAAPAPAPIRTQTLTPAPALTAAPRKADGLDKSAASMEKLITAAKNGDNAKVSELLASGIDPDGPGPKGETPLMAATSAGHCAVVETLCAAFADPTMGKGEDTPMTIAFQKGKQDILKVLFKASFDIMGPNAKSEICPMSLVPDNKDVPEGAEQDLREVTKMIAHLGAGRPDSPVKAGKYGNYAHMASTDASADAEKDSDMMREQSVRLAMKSLVKTANAEITGLDNCA